MSPSRHRINFWQLEYIAVDQLGAKCIESSSLNSMKMEYYLVEWSIVSFLRGISSIGYQPHLHTNLEDYLVMYGVSIWL